MIVACIPAFNEESSIASVIVRAKGYVDRVLVCDDGSGDLTGRIAEEMGVDVIVHERNMGYGAALRSLFSEALSLGADVVVTLDADGQHNPAEIPSFLERIGAGDVDLVIGSRFVSGGGSQAPPWRNEGIKLITGLACSDGVKVTDSQSGFRAYTRGALESLTLTEQGMGVSTEILLKAGEMGLRVAEIPVHVSYDENSSVHNPVLHGLDVVLSTVKHLSMRRPLLFYGLPGLVTLSIAAFFWAMTFSTFAASRTISTNVTLVALSATIVGLMLTTTAIILWVMISVIRERG